MANPYVGAARAVLGQGLGMGWGDEAEAWLRSKLGQGGYNALLDQIRGQYQEYSEQHPYMSTAGEFAGGMIPGAAAMLVPGGQALGAAQIGRSALGTAGRMAGLGAVSGAVSGAGSATEGNRVQGAGAGAALGGVLGGAVPVVTKAGGAGARWLAERANPSEARVTERAARKANEALRESGLKPQDIANRLTEDRLMGVPSTVANADRALADLAEAVAQRTGRGTRQVEETLVGQKAGARERVYQQVARGLHPGDYYADEQKLVSELRKKAGSVYDAAYARGVVDDPALTAVLKDPTFAGFFQKAKGIAEKEAMAAKLRGEDPSKYQLPEIYTPKFKIDPATGQQVPDGFDLSHTPDVRTLDYIKRGIDATIDSGFRGEGMSKAEANALRQLRNEFVSTIDRNVPEYQTARKMYAGEMEVLDAMRLGMKDFGKLDHEQVSGLVSGMSTAEKEAFRTGVARDLYSRIMDPSSNFNSAQRVVGSPEMRKKLEPLFDNPAQFDLFKKALERESELFYQANNVLGNSRTAKRQMMREGLEEDPGVGQAIATAVTGGFWNSLTSTALRALNKGAMTEATSAKLGNMLMSSDPAEVAAVVRVLERQAAEAAPKAARAGALEGGLTTGLPAALWTTETSREPQVLTRSLEEELQRGEQTPMGGSALEWELRKEGLWPKD